MIRLDVKEYCHECPHFAAVQQGPEVLYASEEEIYISEAVISCAHAAECEAIRRFLEVRS